MKLIKVLKTNNTYEIKTLITYRFLNIRFLSLEKSFIKNKEENSWIETKSHKRAPKEKELKLDKWLKNHQKFIEKI